MAKSGKKALAIGGLITGLLFLLGMSSDDASGELDEPGTPGGQPPPDPDPDPSDPDPEIPIYTFIPWDPEPQDPGGGGFNDPTMGHVPWTDPTAGDKPWNPLQYEHPTNYPTPGTFHRVQWGDIFGGQGSAKNLAWACLYEAGYAAAVEVGGANDEEARAFAKSIASKGANRAKYRDLIQCSAWNDVLYGTWGYGSDPQPGPHGRAITLLPIHADNRERILSRESPIRNIHMRKASDKGKGNAHAIDPEYRDGYEYLWMPALNLVALWEQRRITSEGMTWDDGSSMMNPPPEIWDLGVEVLEDPGLDTYGCLEGENTWT